MSETALPLPAITARLDLPTLLRATALYLAAIRDGLDHTSFAETFNQYGPLWDAVYDGCAELLALLDGGAEESEEPEEPTGVEPVPRQQNKGKAGIAPEVLETIRAERQRYPKLPLAAFAMHLCDTGIYRTGTAEPASTSSLHKWLKEEIAVG